MADSTKESREELIGDTSIQEQYAEMAKRKKESKNVGELHVKVNVDVSEALVGLKAIQREAREATKALRELEEVQRNTVTDDIRRCYE